MWTILTGLGTSVVDNIAGYFKNKQAIKKAVVDNKIRLAQGQQSHNHSWEMAQLENAGWKDDVLFYAILGMFVWSAIDPEASKVVFTNWQTLPAWFLEITGWLVASVLGVKKIGEYLPGLISGVKGAIKK